MDKGLSQLYILMLKYGGKIETYMTNENTYTLIRVDPGQYYDPILVRLNEDKRND